MPVFTWSNSLSTNIDSIDREHKRLVEMLNEFYDNIITKSNKENISALIMRMKEYTLIHFNNEEKLLAKYNYPLLSSHKKEHQKFIEKVTDLEKRFDEGKMILSLEVTIFLKDWLQNHIMVSDKKYAEFLIEKGVY